MKKIALIFVFVFIFLHTHVLFAEQVNLESYNFPEPKSDTLFGRNIDFDDFVAGMSVKSSVQRTFINLSLFYEKTAFFYDPGTYGLGIFTDAELGLITNRVSLFAQSKFSLKREGHDAGFENFETGLKYVFLRAYNDSVSMSTHISASFVERADTAYVPDDFYNLGFSFAWGVPYVIAVREMLVVGADFQNFSKYLSRTEFEFSREKVYNFGRTSLILALEYEYLSFESEKNEDHYEFSFTLFNISGIYYTFAWRFGTADEYIYHNRLGLIIKF